MKRHILAALSELAEQWEELLARLSEGQITTPLLPSPWSVKDDLAHLWAWQQRTLARVEGARLNQAPNFPPWPAELDPEIEDNTEQVNAWIYAAHREQPWPEVHQNWKEGFQRLLESAEAISERDLLDWGKYPWLEGHPLANILLATYTHHQEHLEQLRAWLQAHEAAPHQ